MSPALSTVTEAPTTKLEFQGGSVEVNASYPRVRVEGALSWLATAQDARQRARMHREHGHFPAALEAERCASYALTRAEVVLADLRERLP